MSLTPCSKCGGFIGDPGKVYGYVGKRCHCGWKQVQQFDYPPYYPLGGQYEALQAEIEALRAQLETERMRLAACGTAALGYFDGCNDEYRSASLEDVLRLRAQLRTARNDALEEAAKVVLDTDVIEETYCGTVFDMGRETLSAAAAAIRALKEKT